MRNNSTYKKERTTEYNTGATDTRELYLRQIFLDRFRQAGLPDGLVDPPSCYDQLTHRLPYEPDLGGYNDFVLSIYKSCHIGQLKLLMAEISGINQLVKLDNSTNYREKMVIIYAGSAPSMKLLFLMILFPNAKFICIDPNEFYVYDDDYDLPHYIRQAPDYVNRGGKWGGIHSERNRREQHKDDFIYLSYSSSDMYTSSKDNRKHILLWNSETKEYEHHIKPTTRGGRDRRLNQHVGEFNMLSPRVTEDSIEFAFTTDKHRVFFIEEYMTGDIARMIANVQQRHPVKTMFWSDIRTNLESEFAPKDEDIIVNNWWTGEWLAVMKPDLAMLKFRLPFLNDPQSIDISKYRADADRVTALGLNWANPDDWLNGRYPFFNGRIDLQCYHGAYSKETRMMVTRADIEAAINGNSHMYDVKEYDEKFNWFNNIERFSLFYENRHANESLGIDHCFDCSLMGKIIDSYIELNPSFKTNLFIMQLERVLKIRIMNRNGAFSHGHKSLKHNLKWMIERITKSDYSFLHRR